MATSTTRLPDQRDGVGEKSLDHASGLYRHVKRPEWGVAILAWEKGERRAYQFEDGRLRRFRNGYYSLMQPVDEVEGSQEALVSELEAAIEARRRGPPEALEPVCSFQEQIELFQHLYPDGFQGDKWVSDHREDPDGRALKRHRMPVARAFQERLSREACDSLLDGDRHDDLVESALEVLSDTSLVALKHVKTLRGLDTDDRVELAETLRDLLHGEEEFGPRFEAWTRLLRKAFGGRPSWRIATAPAALMYPEDHVCVRRSAFIRQASSVAPTARYRKMPGRHSYQNFRRVASAVETRLKAAGYAPRDYLDIYDFVWATLRNAALDHLGS